MSGEVQDRKQARITRITRIRSKATDYTERNLCASRGAGRWWRAEHPIFSFPCNPWLHLPLRVIRVDSGFLPTPQNPIRSEAHKHGCTNMTAPTPATAWPPVAASPPTSRSATPPCQPTPRPPAPGSDAKPNGRYRRTAGSPAAIPRPEPESAPDGRGRSACRTAPASAPSQAAGRR